MLITFQAGLGRWSFWTWNVVFSSCHNNHEPEQSPTGGVFESVRGTPIRDVPKRGKILLKRGLPKLSRDSGVCPRLSMPKRGTCSHPTFDHSCSPAIHSRKKKTGWLGGVQEARETLQILIWGRFDGEHGRRRWRKAVSPFLSVFSGETVPGTPFC